MGDGNIALSARGDKIPSVTSKGIRARVDGFSVVSPPGASTGNPLPMPVKWLYVLKNGSITLGTETGTGTGVQIPGAGVANPVVGRVAFWTDDETCKININTASEGLYWDKPIGIGSEELGGINGFSYISPFGYTSSFPASSEFQRVPGHPASTSLSTVFGYGLAPVLPDTSLDNASLTWPLTSGPSGSYQQYFGPYFSLTPRLQAGGSMGGAQQAPSYFVAPAYRLYDSIDELNYDPSRVSLTSGNAALYPATNGASPSGRLSFNPVRAGLASLTPAVIDQRRFFLTAHSRAPEETLFGTPRVSLWPLQADTTARTAKDNLLAFCSTLNTANGVEPYYFQRASYYQLQASSGAQPITNPGTPSSQSATADFPGPPTSNPVTPGVGNVARNENLYAYLQALTGTNIPGFGGKFLDKYPGGPNSQGTTVTDRDQILTEMLDLIRSGVNTFNLAPNVYPQYTYTPWNVSSNPDYGAGSTIPISIPTNGTHGLGRNYTLAEVAMVFTAASIDLSTVAAGTLDNNNSTLPIPPTLRRISIGAGVPWACEEDYWPITVAPIPRLFLYYDTNTSAYGSYYIGTDPVSNARTPYVYPQTTPATPLPQTAIPVPIFCYWDTATTPPQYGSYFEAPPGAPSAGSLFVCSSPPNPPMPAYVPPVPPATPASLPNTAVTFGDPQTTGLQAFLIVRPECLLPAPPLVNPDIRVKISNLEGLTLTVQNPNTSGGGNMGFPSAGSAVAVYHTNNSGYGNLSSTPLGGLTTAFMGWYNRGGGFQAPPWTNDGTDPTKYTYPFVSGLIPFPSTYPTPYGGEEDPRNKFTGATDRTPPPPPRQIHSLEDISPGGNYVGSTMQINGAPLKIEFLDGATLKPFETYYVDIPSMTLPVPTVEKAEGVDVHGGEPHALPATTWGNSTVTPRNTSPTTLAYYYQMDFDPYGITNTNQSNDPHGFQNRVNPNVDINYSSPSMMLSLINRGDVVRSFVVNPKSQIAGDMRLLMANPMRPQPGSTLNLSSDDFVPLGSERTTSFYNSFPTQGPYNGNAGLFIRQLDSLYTDYGLSRIGPPLLQTSQPLLETFPFVELGQGDIYKDNSVPPLPVDTGTMQNYGFGMGETSGSLIVDNPAPAIGGERYADANTTIATPELTGAFMDSTAATPKMPGDWTIGIGANGDGPYVEKPDESAQAANGTSNYWETGGGNNIGADFSQTNISNSPNRQVPSPVIFGSLPSRVYGGMPTYTGSTPTNSGGVPWCTLLFCPNPAANDSGLVHPGFGLGSGTPGPNDYPPYAAPPDHLLLDLFWMPVVEPYALSEPFSTAGKVNMNYEIVPFGSYIHRSTALHAVMKSTRIVAIPATYFDAGIIDATSTSPESSGWPSFRAFGGNSHFLTPPTGSDFSLRYGINLKATIDDAASAFQVRFIQQKDIFRSASEICNVFLVPQMVPGHIYNDDQGKTPEAKTMPADASYTKMSAWWSKFELTGDSDRESPYNQIYPRLTTKSNTFQVNMRVQVLSQTTADRASSVFNSTNGDSIVSEYRGSAIIERYIDPNQTNPTPLPDFATTFPANPSGSQSTVDNYVRYRVVNVHDFSP